jgi:type II secretory pathway pseudopilin PulG
MLVVVMIISLAAGVSYPSLLSGLDALRINDASAQVANFIAGAINRVDRRQQVLELTIAPKENSLRLESAEPGYVREMKLNGATISEVLPGNTADPQESRRFYLLPGAVAPRITVVLANKRSRRLIRIDPVTGVPVIERPKAEAE